MGVLYGGVRSSGLQRAFDEMDMESLKSENKKLKAELAAARPLIEAVEKSIPPNRPAFAGTQNGKKAWEQKVIRAALAYRESKERANG